MSDKTWPPEGVKWSYRPLKSGEFAWKASWKVQGESLTATHRHKGRARTEGLCVKAVDTWLRAVRDKYYPDVVIHDPPKVD